MLNALSAWHTAGIWVTSQRPVMDCFTWEELQLPQNQHFVSLSGSRQNIDRGYCSRGLGCAFRLRVYGCGCECCSNSTTAKIKWFLSHSPESLHLFSDEGDTKICLNPLKLVLHIQEFPGFLVSWKVGFHPKHGMKWNLFILFLNIIFNITSVMSGRLSHQTTWHKSRFWTFQGGSNRRARRRGEANQSYSWFIALF